MEVILASLANSLEGKTIVAIATLSLLDFVTGSIRALQGHTFQVAAFGAWILSSLLNVVVIAMVIIVGKALGPYQLVPGIEIDLITSAGIAAAVSFGAVTIKSILDNLNPKVRDVVPSTKVVR